MKKTTHNSKFVQKWLTVVYVNSFVNYLVLCGTTMVLLTSFGEPKPYYFIDKKIRIIDSVNKIGFANEQGQIIIKPQFEIVT